MTIEQVRTLAILVADAYGPGVIAFTPNTVYEPQRRVIPRAQLTSKLFRYLFEDSEYQSDVELICRDSEYCSYEYQVDVNKVQFFCITDKPFDCFES